MRTSYAEAQIKTFTLTHDPIMPGGLFSMRTFDGVLIHPSELLVPHRKDYFLFILARKGNARHWVDMKSFDTKPNTIYFFVPDQVITKEEPKPMHATAVAISKEFLALQENQVLAGLPVITNPEHGHELLLAETDLLFVESVLQQLNTAHQQADEWQHKMISAHLVVLLTYLSKLYTLQFGVSAKGSSYTILQQYQETIEQHFKSLHLVSEYAELLHLSPGHLSELVKNQSGKSAIMHIHDRIVLESRRLLYHSKKSIKQIAFELNFSDASFFGRFFKQRTGITPAEYRRQIREMYH
ncbi:MAG: helix-turn-helix domain-containing protein [Pedobacter agri]